MILKSSNNRKFNKAKTARNLGLIAAAGSAVFSAATVGAANYLVEQLIKPNPVNASEAFTFSPFELQLEHERISFPTADGSLVEGWLLPRPDTNRVVIAVSGYRGRKEDMLGISSHLWRNGFNLVLFDYRGHGLSRTKADVLTLGHRELEDFQAAVKYVRQRFDKPLIGAVGGSMGAAVSLIAAARDKDIRCVWSDSSFARQRDVIAHNWKNITHLPDWPVVDVAEKLFELRTGHLWQEFAPILEIAKIAPRPVYIVHGALDTVAPVSDAYALYEAATGPKQLWIEDDFEHCGVYFGNREEYSRRALAFFQENLVSVAKVQPPQIQNV